MITMRNWIVENTVHDSLIGYERDHLARRLEISTDLGPEWALKLDLERDGKKNVVDLERDGDVLYVDLTRDMLAGDGHYRAQLRGLSGEVVRHSNVFWLVVSNSINAIDSFPPLKPTEMAQMEERVTKAKDEAVAAAETVKQYSGNPPIIQDGTWWIWDAESKSYMDTGEAAQGPSGPQGPAGEGRGDMLASVYDPAGKGQDVFAYAEAAAKSVTAGQVFNGEIIDVMAGSDIASGDVVYVVNISDLIAQLTANLENYLASPRTDEDLTVLKNTLTVASLNTRYFIRKNRAGDKYVAAPPASNLNAAKTAIGNLANALIESSYYDNKTGVVSLSWDQIQYFFVEGTLVDSITAISTISNPSPGWNWSALGFIPTYIAYPATQKIRAVFPYKIAISLSGLVSTNKGAAKVIAVPMDPESVENIPIEKIVGVPLDSYVVGGQAGAVTKTPAEVAADVAPHIPPVSVGGIPILTTYTPEGGTDGVDYAADVPGATELFRGLHIIIMPHITSTDVKTNLNVNGLGRKLLRRYLSASLSGNAAPYSGLPGWMAADKPILLMYTGSYWTVIGNTQPSAGDLNGYVTPDHGGTGLSTIPAGSYLVGNGTEKVQTKTPEEVRVDIGAAPPAKLTMVTLMADGWTDNSQTVAVPGVLADETKQAITPSPSPESWEAAGKAMVWCSAQGADSLTFVCKSVPVENLSYCVVIQEVGS